LIFSLVLSSTPAFANEHEKAEHNRFDGQLTFTADEEKYQIKNLPKFENFPAEAKASGKTASDIDWSSNKDARAFKTRLRKGLKKGPNFNGHYVVISHGCGSPCQVNWIVDVNNGKVVGAITTSLGASYNLKSGLIVGDLADQPTLQELFDARSVLIKDIQFYKVEHDTMTKIKSLNVYEEVDKLKKK